MKHRITIVALIIITLVAVGLLGVVLAKMSSQNGLKLIKSSQAGQDGIIIVTHGWIEKGKDHWPQDMAEAIQKRVDANEWLCGYFDWSKGAATINPTDAADYGRGIAGSALAGQILKVRNDWKHIHLLGHSCGGWVISEAAKILAKNTTADLHLTLLDAYIPPSWYQSEMADINTAADVNFWAEHYYTRDYTLDFTAHDLTHAHNIDVTEVDQWFKDHNFPWKWYYATVTGTFPKWSMLDKDKLITDVNGVEYGFARSREKDPNSWGQSLKLGLGNSAIKLRKAKPSKP